MASDVYTIAKYHLANGSLGWTNPSAVFRCMLVTPAYTFNLAHEDVADVAASEVSDPSYSRQDVTGRTAILDIPGDRGILDAESTNFPGLDNVTVGGAIIYRQIGGNDFSPGSDILLAFVDLPDTVANGTNFLVEYFADGIVALTTC